MLSRLTSVPDDALASAFSCLEISYDGTYTTSFGTTENLKLVNKRFHNIVCEALSLYHNIRVSTPLPSMPVTKINDFFRQWQLYKLELNSPELIAYKEVLNAITSSTQDCAPLQELNFRSMMFKFSADNILNKLFNRMQAITSIIFNLCMNLTDADIDQLQFLPRLKILQCIICPKLTVQSVKSIAENNASLIHLVLEACQGLTPDLATPLKNNKYITKLSLKGSHVNDSTLLMISTFQKLNDLNISECPDVTEEGMRHLVDNGTPITHLHCANAILINDNAVLHISRIPTLQHLQLANNAITGDSLNSLQLCRSLASLSLSRLSEIKDSEIRVLTNNMSLTSLSLTYLEITSAMIGDVLITLPNIAHLQLYGYPINNEMFAMLTACHKLKTLTYSHIPGMQSIEDIKALLPDVVIKKILI